MPSAHAPLLSEYRRALELGSEAPPARFLSRTSDFLAGCDEVWSARRVARFGPLDLAIGPTDASLTFNSGYADDRNNGSLWSGRGVSLGVQTGILARLGWISVGAQPVLSFQENRRFAVRSRNVPNLSRFANAIHGSEIDLPHRFGSGSFVTANLAGQSFARVDALGLVFGIASENFWVGPAMRNPILMSNTAPGFAHAFAGTRTPVDLWLARIDVDVVLGRTAESGYWDEIPENDRGHIAMWVIGVEPRWFDGLELGASRVTHYRSAEALWYGDPEQLRQFFGTRDGRNIAGNELASVFLRWVLPSSGAEFYGEWARDDTWATITDDLVPELDHSQGYMLGFQKVTAWRSRTVRIHAEMSHLQEKAERREDRPLPVFYLHHEGGYYTHRGQLMGSGIGLGADAQYLAVDLLHERGFAGVHLERVRRYEGASESVEARAFYPFDHDTEIGAGVHALLFRDDFAIGVNLSYSRRWNREFLEDDANLRLVSEVSWRPDTGAVRQ